MNKNFITDTIVAKLGDDVVVSFTEVEKNGVMKKAIKVQKHGSQIAPVFYYNPDDSDDKIVDFIVDGLDKYLEFSCAVSSLILKSFVIEKPLQILSLCPILFNKNNSVKHLFIFLSIRLYFFLISCVCNTCILSLCSIKQKKI